MNRNRARQAAKVVLPGLAVGGAIGLGVGLGLYGPGLGVVGSALVGAFVCFSLLRLRASWR